MDDMSYNRAREFSHVALICYLVLFNAGLPIMFGRPNPPAPHCSPNRTVGMTRFALLPNSESLIPSYGTAELSFSGNSLDLSYQLQSFQSEVPEV